MRLSLILLCSLFSFSAFAQKTYVMDIAAGPVMGREIYRGKDYRVSYAASGFYGFQTILKIKGENEGNSELNIIPAFTRSITQYDMYKLGFGTHSNNWSLQSEVVLKKPERRINPTLGIGVMRSSIIGMNFNTPSVKERNVNTPAPILTQLRDMDKRVHPFFTTSVNGVFKVGIRQLDISAKALFNLSSTMSKPTNIYPWASMGYPGKVLNANTAPVFFSLSVNYYYSRLLHWDGPGR